MSATRTKTKEPEANESSVAEQELAAIADPVSITGYDSDLRFYSTRYKQGGRIVYGLDLSLAQITTLVPKPDPEKPTPGNRAIRLNHAKGFGKYLRNHENWVSPSMLLRAPAIFDFDTQIEIGGTEFGIVSFPRLKLGDLHILDGQHRIYGIHDAMETLAEDLDRARSALATARRNEGDKGPSVAQARGKIKELEKRRETLAGEHISIQLIVESDPRVYKQMFFDIADNALGITASVKSRFDSRKVVNRALEFVFEHPLLKNRIDEERDRLGRGSPFLVGAKHVGEIVRTITVGLEGRVSRRQEVEFEEREIAERTNRYLTTLTEAFPQLKAVELSQLLPEQLRKTSLLGSVLMLRILGGVYYDLVTEREWEPEQVREFFELLAPHMEGPVYPGSIWMEHTDVYTNGSMAPNGRRQDIRALKDAILDWSLTKPAWLKKKPAPRPSANPEEDHPEYGKGYTDFGAPIPGK